MAADSGGNRARAFVGLGSNIEPEANVRKAVAGLAGLGDVSRLSTLYRTRAVGHAGPDFINGVVLMLTDLGRDGLLEALAGLEAELGRKRGGERYAPRVIDLDLLLFLPGSSVVSPGPSHKDVYDRTFVAGPLAEIAPELVLPDGRAARDVAAGLGGVIGEPLDVLTGELLGMIGQGRD